MVVVGDGPATGEPPAKGGGIAPGVQPAGGDQPDVPECLIPRNAARRSRRVTWARDGPVAVRNWVATAAGFWTFGAALGAFTANEEESVELKNIRMNALAQTK